MTTFVLSELEAAIRSSWSAETATPPNRELWSVSNPAWDQCGVTALVVSDLLGGDLVCGEVHRDGVRIDYHWWNLLGAGVEVDLTREQFVHGEQVVGKEIVTRPPNEKIVWLRTEYELLSERVRSKLGLCSLLDAPGGAGHRDTPESGDRDPKEARRPESDALVHGDLSGR